jgi:hypothetical protein
LNPSPSSTTEFAPLKIELGPADGMGLEPGLPVLAGDTVENLFPNAQPVGSPGMLTLFQAGPWRLGSAVISADDEWEAAVERLYSEIFTATHGLHLARIWQYVPAINGPGPGGLENYRIFCRARSLAFERHYGAGFKQLLPSASAVGTTSGALTIVFAASAIVPRHVENPLQMSAYDYPKDYGPRPPSFARATVVPGTGSRTVFISGTAAIRGHATIASHQVLPQLECTLENLREISRACGLGPDLDRTGRATRSFKVYLRHIADQPAVAAVLQRRLIAATDRVSYLQADICRKALSVEIEASLFGVR